MLLGIDTSGAVSVAVAREGEVLAVRTDTRARHHDEVLLALVDETLQAAGASRTELTGVVAGRGPGPFTGLRVGLVSARTIASVLQVPLYGLCSLDALAHQALAAHPGAEPLTVGVALDARRREVYHARYRRAEDGRLERIDGPAVAAPADVTADLTACDLLVGSGTALYPDLLPATDPLEHVDAGHLLRAAVERLAAGEDLSDTAPLYLREPDAAKPTARKSALGR
ncbi:tRNA (adenosine(37)-N6)-threonylcarbamoyltransferase complex dimerization subunit type 1 TsaB [Brachybacterium sp. J144]|uniref:tRNA (adenosine(37)-N6)-threonylcarbamoyltransferase complex dimerization subunit type 1 TsaB n=1 Tax=Brachybacterium sp. J144 TaxID=3116487 RepID=UPI002E7A9081|nr:tRNA (adenosine(37)-N6)-threonylcarbamoyltransferase complex dimerization subunit type 1 TsaB [Brachybacterium sp. J144]MEE1651979.1 tRNA (adenosine(37)-N6)-threonylcarbamoyltransferase complex dimerization subunit type 1 TsaB [Brachybacterium sp. J144]